MWKLGILTFISKHCYKNEKKCVWKCLAHNLCSTSPDFLLSSSNNIASLLKVRGLAVFFFFFSFIESFVQCMCVSCSAMSDSVIPGTVAHQATLSLEFSRQECWSGLLFPSPLTHTQNELYNSCKFTILFSKYFFLKKL